MAKRAGFYRRPALCYSVSGRSMWTRPARPTQCGGECRICAGCKSSLRPSVTWFGLTGPCHVVFRLLAAWQRWPRRGGSRNYVPQTGRPQVLGSNCWGLYLMAMANAGVRAHLQRVPAHWPAKENELADALAKEASELPQQNVPA